MAKAAVKKEEPPEPIIATLADADSALQQIGELSDRIAGIEGRHRKAVRLVQDRMKAKTEADYVELRLLEKALEDFATKERKKILPAEEKSLALRFGSIGFRFSPWGISFLKGWTEEKIIEKLKASKLKSLIRITEAVKKPACLEIDDKVLEKCGMEKSRDELFFYKLAPRPVEYPS